MAHRRENGHAQRTISGHRTACHCGWGGDVSRPGSQGRGDGADECAADFTPKSECETETILVFVAGSVKRPGLYTLAEGTRAFEAVAKAGGLRADADPAGVDLAAPLSDGEEIAAPVLGTRRSAARGIRNAPHVRKSGKKKTSPVSIEAIDLNAADASALAQLPGIGEELAQRVVTFRQANGDFVSLDELADVAGMSQSRIDAITPYLFVNH